MPQEVVEALRKARKAVKREVAQAKRDWMSDVVSKLSKGRKHPAAYWEGVKTLKGGLQGHTKRCSVQRFKNAEGELCTNSAENLEAKIGRAHV